MRLGIDAREIQEGVYTGIGRPLVNFLHYFAKQKNDDTCVLFSAKEIPVYFGPRVSNTVIPQKNTLIWDQWLLPRAIKDQGINVFYSPYYKIPLLKNCKSVSAILDLMYLAYGPYYREMPSWAKVYYAIVGRLFAYRADQVLTCSEFSKKDINRIYGINEGKIKNIPLSIAPIYFEDRNESKIAAVKEKFNIKGRYILYMGNFKAHKNVTLLIHAFAEIAPKFPGINLVLAGPKEHTYLQLMNIIEHQGLSERVIFTGKVKESDGPQYLYQGAEVLVMPSLYEGFGLPPIEAMACGTFVIASKSASITEIIQDAGVLFDPYKDAELVQALRKVLRDPTLKKEYINKGLKRARDFETEKIAQEMYDFLKSLEGIR